jgi:hypothetical protein
MARIDGENPYYALTLLREMVSKPDAGFYIMDRDGTHYAECVFCNAYYGLGYNAPDKYEHDDDCFIALERVALGMEAVL